MTARRFIYRLRRSVSHSWSRRGEPEPFDRLGDFTTTPQVISISLLAVAIGAFGAAVYRMAETGFTRLPVVEQASPRKVVGMITLSDLLKARKRNLQEEQLRERALRIRLLFRPSSKEKVEQL
jgi:hypothetical protein